MEITNEMMNRIIELSSMTDEDYFTQQYMNNPEEEIRKGRPPAKLINPLNVIDYYIDFKDADEILWLDNILSGTIACLQEDITSTHKGNKLSDYKLLRLYEHLREFTTDNICRTLDCKPRMAQYYMQAIKASNPFISAYLTHQYGA